MILDGTLVPTDRCAEQTLSVKGESIDVWYSGKAHQHAGNLQALSAPDGLPLWIADVEPGSVHDLTAARTQVLGALYAAAARGLPTLADSGYDGAGIGIHTPIRQPERNQELSPDNRTYNRLLRALRCLGERGFALLKGRWRTLQHITVSPSKIGDIALYGEPPGTNVTLSGKTTLSLPSWTTSTMYASERSAIRTVATRRP